MTKQELKKMSKDQIVKMCVEQNTKINEIRGYDNGLRTKHFKEMNKTTLINYYAVNRRNFKIDD